MKKISKERAVHIIKLVAACDAANRFDAAPDETEALEVLGTVEASLIYREHYAYVSARFYKIT